MFRLTRYMQSLSDKPVAVKRPTIIPVNSGPVVIWNLIRRCNLTCKHCYATSADKDFSGELDYQDVCNVMDDLKSYSVPVLILSGGEPLMRADIFDISKRAKEQGFYVGLSTNGTLITDDNIQQIVDADYNYVGISLDGIGANHDKFRRREGAYEEALRGIRLCRDAGIKVGLRFTLTQDNAVDFPAILELLETEDIDKFYLSHLNYAGRGNVNRKHDAHHQIIRDAMDLLFETCLKGIEQGKPREFVTGNNDADAVYLLQWVEKHYPHKIKLLKEKLQRWGGNASGVNISNIDNLGNVHPDTMWWDYTIGNVRERKFSEIWSDTSDPLMAGLKQQYRPVEGRCARCDYLSICGGNTRTRAWQLTGNFWAEDPGCYLTNEEIGLDDGDVSTENIVIPLWVEN